MKNRIDDGAFFIPVIDELFRIHDLYSWQLVSHVVMGNATSMGYAAKFRAMSNLPNQLTNGQRQNKCFLTRMEKSAFVRKY